MHLETFLKNTPEKIYKRGEEYYAGDLVHDVIYEKAGNWTATVEGSEDYEVEVVLDGDNIISWDCNCPYDYEDVCKHVVALLLYVRDNRNSYAVIPEPDEETSPKKEDLSDLFKNTDKKAIVSFLTTYAKQHPDFLQELERALLPVKKEIATVDYKKEIEKCFSVRNRDLSYNQYGYSNEEEVIAGKLYKFSEKAKFFIKKGLFEDALAIALSIMEEIAGCCEEYEDYNGELCGACQEAGSVVEEVIQHCDSKSLMALLINKLGQFIKNKNFDHYDLADINGLLFSATLKSSGVDDGIKLLDETLKSEPDSSRTDFWVKTKLELLENAGRSEEVKQEIDKYLYLPEIRKIKIDRLLASKEYEKAILLIDEGITEAEKKNHHGTVLEWKNAKLSIYRQTENKEKIISIARDLFFNGRDAMIYYHILKGVIPSSQWATYLDNLLVQKKNLSVHPKIFMEEKCWDRLMNWVLEHTSLNNKYDSASNYEKNLRPHFPEQLVEMYRSRVIAYAAHNMGRDHYQFVAKMLQKMQAYPNGNKIVAELVDDFRKTYANRRAMMEELKEF